MTPTPKQVAMALGAMMMTQADAARALGVVPETFWRMIHGKTPGHSLRKRFKAMANDAGITFSATNGTVSVTAPADE